MADDVHWSSMNILNLSSRGLSRIEVVADIQPIAAIFDKNQITRIEHLEFYKQLQQLSLADNRITHIHGLNHITNLTVLNLPNNRITTVSGLRELTKLTWLNLSGNKIKTIEQFDNNIMLEHLDLSDNILTRLGNITMCTKLKTLLLHGNNINTLKLADQFLPQCLSILSLAENSLVDLNEVGNLTSATHLEQLSVMNNPCVMMLGILPVFDYRPFVVNWCMNLRILDGYIISEKEGLKAEWLYSQGKGRHFKPGQHVQLIQYLSQACPQTTTTKESVDEDLKLSRILQQQKVHQQEIEEEEHSIQQQHLPFENYAIQQHTDCLSSDMSVGGPEQLTTCSHSQGHPGTSELSDRPLTTAGYKVTDRGQRSDITAQYKELTSDSETNSMLDADTRYLPLPNDMAMSPVRPLSLDFTAKRPSTAPPVADDSIKAVEPQSRNSVADFNFQRVGSGSDSSSLSKYDMLENRPIKPLKQSMITGLSPKLSPKSGSVGMNPTPSELQPQPSTKKRSQSPVMRAINFNTTGTEDSDSDAKSQTANQLKLLKSMLSNKGRSQNSKPKPVEVSHRAVNAGLSPGAGGLSPSAGGLSGGQSPSSGGLSPSAGGSSQKSQYSAAKYRTPTRRSLLEKQQETNNGKTDLDYKAKVDESAIRIQSLWRGFYTRNYNAQVLKVRQELRSRRAEQHIRMLKAEIDRQRGLYEQEKQLRCVQLDALKYLWKQVKSLQSWKAEILQSVEQGTTPIESLHQPDVLSGGQVTVSERASNSVSERASNAVSERASNSVSDRASNSVSERASTSVQTSQDFMERSMKEMLLTSQRANLTAEEGFTLTPRRSECSPNPTLTTPLYPTSSSSHPHKEQYLENVCKSLQEQVCELQDVLKSMSNYVFQGGIISADKQPTGVDPIHLSEAISSKGIPSSPTSGSQQPLPSPTSGTQQPPPSPTSGSHQPPASPTSKTATHLPSSFTKSPSSNPSSNNSSPRAGSSGKVPPPAGIPSAPWGLKLQQHGTSRVILQWQPSILLSSNGKSKQLQGYRIYVNGTAKGTVAGTQTRALLEGLLQKITYRISVRGVSSLGESSDSNVVLLNPDCDAGSESTPSRSRGDDSDRDDDGKMDNNGAPPPGGGGSHSGRRRHRSSGSSPGGGSRGSSGGRGPSDTTSTPKHVQFDTSNAGVSPDSGYTTSPVSYTTSPSNTSKDKYSRTYPPTPQFEDISQTSTEIGSPKLREKREKRVPVSERLKSSSMDCVTDNTSHDHSVLSTSPKEGFKKLETAMERGQVSKEDFIKFAFDKGIISKEEIVKMASKMNKRKHSIDTLTAPMKAFSTEDMLLDSDGASKKDATTNVSKIPLYTNKVKQFDSSSESIDIPQHGKSKDTKQYKKDVKKSESFSGITNKQRKSAPSSDGKNKVSSIERRKHLDSSGSESCSPQVSPCNTSSGLSLGGTTGSESGSDHSRRNSHGTPPSHRESQPTQCNRRSSSNGGRDSSTESKESYAAARKINLTRPNPPPIPPPMKDKAVHSPVLSDERKQKTPVENIALINESESNSVKTVNKPANKQTSPARVSNDTFLISPAQLEEIHKSHDSLNRTPPRLLSISGKSSERSPQSKEHGYTPSFFQDDSPSSSRKIFLRRGDPGELIHDKTDPNIITDENEQVQKIVQSDGSVTYASYRKVSLDRGSDGDLESLAETQSLFIPGSTVEDTTARPPPTPETVRKTVIDSDDNVTEDEVLQRSRRGRSSMRSSRRRSKERRKQEDGGKRRSSSVGTLMRKLSIKREKEKMKDVVANKPPKPPTPPTGRSPNREDSEKKGRSQRNERRRTKSETNAVYSDSDDPQGDDQSKYNKRPPRPRSRSHDRSPRRRDNSSDRGSSGKLASSEGSSDNEMTKEMARSSPSSQRKAFLKHKRSASDLSNITVLPDRPASPATSPRKPAPPSTPKQGMSSPRVRRSSSFSKAMSGSSSMGKSSQPSSSRGSTSVRQCISLETLKAVKSKSQEMMNKAGTSEHNETDLRLSDLEDESDSSLLATNVRRSVSSEVINDPSRIDDDDDVEDISSSYPNPLQRSGSLRDDRLLYMSKYKNELGSEFKVSGGDISGKGRGYSPKLLGRSPGDDDEGSKGQRRIKLGSKAADLFAKLTMKLSSGK